MTKEKRSAYTSVSGLSYMAHAPDVSTHVTKRVHPQQKLPQAKQVRPQALTNEYSQDKDSKLNEYSNELTNRLEL